ncbi:hypothetical protein Lal_00010104 [Lupinus albus]|uniref:Putative transcription factor bHLH family n=1 Tax=Lupinus albus TaxID=3870 RepID=A0A6A5LIQ3_LUPAL|nr:putative transcription factor bHLH family [Lupinus albus]KAF1859520.1 hypothetical protein Lal_00010104 [Lupinus albus]
MDAMNFHQDNLMHFNDFDLHEFIDDPNSYQFINSIQVENDDPISNFDSNELINDCFFDNNQFQPYPLEKPMFEDHTNNNVVNVYDPSSSTLNSFSCFYDDNIKGDGEEANDGVDSSATGTTIDPESMLKTDRSKTLISERRRRGRMKDKLYALRALVPNITKMDKASIIGDAVQYVNDLQAQAKKLKVEVTGLETSLLVSENYQGSIKKPLKFHAPHNMHPISKKIMQIDMLQVEEKGYYTKIVSNKGEGVAASLYKALESLSGFNVQNSNLSAVCDTFILTFTLNVKGSNSEINLPNLKLWVTGALLNQGFELMPFFHA